MSNKQGQNLKLNRRELLKCGFYSSLALGTGSFFLTGCEKKSKQKKKTSIILISVDTLRTDHLSCYGYHRNTSPNIDQFAKESMLFENCLSHASETWASMASVLSGFLPHETKITKGFGLLPSVETIPEILQPHGYATLAVVSNYVLRKNQGFEQGFWIYDDTMNDYEIVRNFPERIAEHTTNRAIELLWQFHEDDLFLWIHYQDPHGPYTPPAQFAKMFINPDQKPHNLRLNNILSGMGGIPSYQKLGSNRDYYYYVSQFDSEIRYFDEHFKRLITELKKLGLYDEALIIFTSDHGEGLGEHNCYFAHAENLYHGLTHVPLIIKYGNKLTGKRSDFVQHIDIVPTILEILGLKRNKHFRGEDLRKPTKKNKEIFAQMNSMFIEDMITYSLVVDGLKLIFTPLYKKYELFDIKTDLREEKNLINDSKYTSQSEDLKKRLERILREDFLNIEATGKAKELTREEREKLKSLGYIK